MSNFLRRLQKRRAADVSRKSAATNEAQRQSPIDIPRLLPQFHKPGNVDPNARKVAILVPCGDMVHTEFATSLQNLILHQAKTRDPRLGDFGIYTYGSSLLPWSRHVLASVSLDYGFTHMLWIDSDMMFPKDMVERFLDRHEPIIGINAMTRRPPYRLTAQKEVGVELETTIESTGVVKCWRVGFGVMWVASEVFTKIDKPWFNFEWNDELKCYRGEDYFFCEKARAQGYEVYVDQDLSKQVFHIGSFGFHPLLKQALPSPEDQAAQR